MSAVEKEPGPQIISTSPSTPTSDDVIATEIPSTIREKQLLRKLDRTILPPLTLLYLLSFLDRSNGRILFSPPSLSDWPETVSVGNARLEGLTADLHMSKYSSYRMNIWRKFKKWNFKLTLVKAGNQYLTGLTLFFIGYVLFEVSKPALLLICLPTHPMLTLKRYPQISFSSWLVQEYGFPLSPSFGVSFPPWWGSRSPGLAFTLRDSSLV